MKRSLVCGAGGFIGGHLVRRLKKEGYWVRGVDIKMHEYVESVADEFIKGDLRDQALLLKSLAGHDTVIHLACISNDPSFELNPNLGKSINLDAFRPLVEISRDSGVRRFVYASSAATYGDGSAGMDDKADDLERYKPLNLYGLSKQKFDVHARNHDMLAQCVGLKYFNVFGPNEDHKGDMRSVVHKSFGH